MKAYIIPKAHFVAGLTESPFMDYSELPKGGDAESFDTRRQNTWTDAWTDADE